MNLQQKFDQLLRQKQWWHDHDVVVVAVSTGVDSMSLLSLLQHLPVAIRPRLVVAYVDHQLRKQSERETAYIRRYCHENELQLVETTWPAAIHPKAGIEAAARRFRYQFFKRVLQESQASILVTAHHGDDLVETVLMKLIRGGQIDSMIGIPEEQPFANGSLIRPLLAFTKRELYQFARDSGITWFEDETNRKLTVERNRIRHQVLPELKRENPKATEHFLDFSDQLQQILQMNRRLLAPLETDVVLDSDAESLKIDRLRFVKLDTGIQERLLMTLLEDHLSLTNVSRKQIKNLVWISQQNSKPQAVLDLGNHWEFVRRYDMLIIHKKNRYSKTNSKTNHQFMVILDRWYLLLNGSKFALLTTPPNSDSQAETFWLSDIDFPLCVRRWQPGDRIRLSGGGHQKVSRILINQKVPNQARKQVQVLATFNGKILAVLGFKTAVLPKRGGDPIFLIQTSSQPTSKGKGINNE